MEIIAVAILIVVGISIEAFIYRKYILPYVYYNCRFSHKEVFEGEQIEIIETVSNPSGFIIPFLKSEISTSRFLDFASGVSTVNDTTRSLASLFTLKAKQKVTRSWKVKCLKRGFYKIEDTTIVAGDLLGQCQYCDVLKVEDTLTVLPKPINLETDLISYTDLQGERVVRRFILEDPFVTAGVREYTPRDSMNKIHWSITAKEGRFMVRNNEATSKQSLTVVLNMQLYKGQIKEMMEDDRIEDMIKIVAGLLDQTILMSLPVKLIANACTLSEATPVVTREMWGKGHVHELFHVLSRLQNNYTDYFSHFIRSYDREIQSTDLIVVTVFIDEELTEYLLEKMRQGFCVKVCLLAYQVDCKVHPDLEIYYLRDYLEREQVS